MVGRKLTDRMIAMKFKLGMRPTINPDRSGIRFPNGERAAVVISADFELAWAWQWVKQVEDPMSIAARLAMAEQRNVPELLTIFDRYSIPVTWATVGALLLERSKAVDIIRSMPQPNPFTNEYWNFPGGWYDNYFKHDDADLWHCPNLIESILTAEVEHEIGCHTFSHIDCAHADQKLMNAELDACRQAAKQFNLDLTSFVFPANYKDNLKTLAQFKYKAFRAESDYEIDFARISDYNLVHIPGGMELEPPSGWDMQVFTRTIDRILTERLPEGSVLSLWFHPSIDSKLISGVFEPLMKSLSDLRDELWITTMSELANWLLKEQHVEA